MNQATLGDLSDPTKFHAPIDVRGQPPEVLRNHLRSMMRIRMVEQHLARMRKEGVIGGPVHLAVGQEAVAVGVAHSLRESDRVFGAHRSHSHILSLGCSVRALFAEVLGKDTGLAKGMGGSMHLWDQPRGFYGSVPIVAGTIPLAVGAALGAKLSGSSDVAVSFFGDGATEEGAFHESLNLASVLGVPVIFVAENNLFSSHMHIDLRQPRRCTARFAQAQGMPFEVVDGNDVVAVSAAVSRLVSGARSGGGAGFLEAVTFRWLGHVDWRDDVDVGVERSAEDLANWKARDPIARLKAGMEDAGVWTEADQEELVAGLSSEITSSWESAMEDPWPAEEALLERVFAPRSRD